MIKSGAIEKKGDKLTFTIREPLLRQYFEEWVAKEKGFTDTSFNKNLVTLNTDTFYKVLDHLANPDMPMGKIKHQLGKEKKIKKNTFKDVNDRQSLLRLFSEEFSKSAGREAGALSIKAAAGLLSMMILG